MYAHRSGVAAGESSGAPLPTCRRWQPEEANVSSAHQQGAGTDRWIGIEQLSSWDAKPNGRKRWPEQMFALNVSKPHVHTHAYMGAYLRMYAHMRHLRVDVDFPHKMLDC